MNTVEIGRKFEEEAKKILKSKFDKVYWLSKRRKSTFDFKCIKGDKIYYGDAKLNKNNDYIYIRESQKTLDFLIIKARDKVYFLLRKDFLESPIKILFSNKKQMNIGIEEDLWRSLIQLKLDLKIRTFDEVISYLLNNQTRMPSAISHPCDKLKLQNSNRKSGGKK